MRIVKEIPHSRLKISILHHNAKFTVQFEDGNIAQQYSIRESEDISTAEDVAKLVNESFVQQVLNTISTMRQDWQSTWMQDVDEDDFEVII